MMVLRATNNHIILYIIFYIISHLGLSNNCQLVCSLGQKLETNCLILSFLYSMYICTCITTRRRRWVSCTCCCTHQRYTSVPCSLHRSLHILQAIIAVPTKLEAQGPVGREKWAPHRLQDRKIEMHNDILVYNICIISILCD